MRYVTWLKVTLTAIGLVIVVRFLPNVPSVHSGQRFQNSHSEIECSQCHALVADLSGSVPAKPIHREQCERCHTPDAMATSGIPLDFHSDRGRGCTECHSFHDVENVSAGNERFRVSFENSFQRGQCYSCHRPLASLSNLSPGHRAAAAIYHSDFGVIGKLSSSQSCLICHSQSAATGAGELAEHARNAPRFDDHGSHPVGVQVKPGQGEPGNKICTDIDSRIQLFGGRIECQTCHCLSSRNQYLLIAFDSRNDLCRACHRVD